MDDLGTTHAWAVAHDGDESKVAVTGFGTVNLLGLCRNDPARVAG